jgi:hypothetical protein
MSRPSLFAVERIRKMRGGSQAHLIRASDGNLYVTKFQNNPGGIRTLASEFLATKLAITLGLPMAEGAVIEVSDQLIENTQELRIEIGGTTIPCATGLQFASRYVADPATEQVFDYMPETQFCRVVNRHDLVRILVFDKWTGNCDGRQAVFTKRASESGYRMTFIDQHYCFNGGRWTFPDLPLMGTYFRNKVYESVTGWESFEPILTKIEEIEYADLWRCAAQIPYDWYEHDSDGLFELVETLYRRRSSVRDLVTAFRDFMSRPFPLWNDLLRSGSTRDQTLPITRLHQVAPV